MSDANPDTPPEDHSANAEARPPRPLTFSEMTAGLIWPTLFRSVVMALQPSRMLMAFMLVVVLGAVSTALDWILGLFGAEAIAAPALGAITTSLVAFSDQLLAMDPIGALGALYDGVFVNVLDLLRTRWLSATVFLLVMLPVWSVLGGALSRMVATDIAGHLSMSARDGLSFASLRVPSFVGSMLLPLVLLLLITTVIAIAGWVLLAIPGVRHVGVILYGGVLVAGLVLTFLFVGFVLGQALLIPAVATEGTDAIDAVQRAYAYLWGRPARALGYAGFCLLQGAIVCALVRWFVGGAIELSEGLSQVWLGDGAMQALTPPADDAPAPWPAVMVGFWNRIVGLLVPAFVVSFYFSASTIVYMLLRRINDEQDLEEIWMPGLAPGTLTPVIDD